MEKTLRSAYICWLLGGIFGFHHLYLGRKKQAFIWMTTFGGLLIGVIRDLYRIPAYIREANYEANYLLQLIKRQSQLKSPSFQASRFFASFVVGTLFDYITKNAIPTTSSLISADELTYSIYLRHISPLVTALIVYLVSTESPYKCNFKWPLIASYTGYFLEYLSGSNLYFVSAGLATIFVNWNIKWKKLDEFKDRKSVFLQVLMSFIFITTAVCFVVIMGTFVLNNTTYESKGKKVTLRESVSGFFKSKEMSQLKEAINIIWNFYQAHGFRKLVNDFFYGYDPQAVSDAYKVKKSYLIKKFFSMK